MSNTAMTRLADWALVRDVFLFAVLAPACAWLALRWLFAAGEWEEEYED